MVEVPAVVLRTARAAGAQDGLKRLPVLVSSLEADEAAYVGQDPVVAGSVDGRLAIWPGTPAAKSTGT